MIQETTTAQTAIDQVRDLKNVSEYRIYEHLDRFHPQIKQMYKYVDTGEYHPTCCDPETGQINVEFRNVFPEYFFTLEEAIEEFDAYLAKPKYYDLEDKPDNRVYEHMNKFYPQKRELLKFEPGAVIHPIYLEPVWLNIFEGADECYNSLEEAKDMLEKYLLPATIHPYTKKEDEKSNS